MTEAAPNYDKLLEKSTLEYRATVYPPTIARAFDISRTGCPVCKDKAKELKIVPWNLTEDKPFKVQCNVCKHYFPDNDFEAYYKSGFKDKSLLKGKYVDSGRGYEPAPGQPKYWFVAYWNHWYFQSVGNHIKLADAYAATGNKEFARRAVAMIDKYAEYYKDYDYNKQSRYAEEVQSSYTGRILNAIWETGTAKNMATAYTKLLPFLDKPDSQLEKLIGKTNEQIKTNIKENMLRVMANDIMTINGRILGNYGMHQVALLKISKILNAPEMAAWVTDFRNSTSGNTTPLDYAIYNNIFGDGAPYESPGYNRIWQNSIGEIANMLKENGINEYAKHPCIPRIMNYPSVMNVCGGKFAPASGDSGNLASNGGYYPNTNIIRDIYKAFPTPLHASILHSLDPKGKLSKDAEEKLDPYYGYRSGILPAYGMATLQNGNKELPTAAVLAFTNNIGHKHEDFMDLEIFAENVPMTPDFGYPESASADDPLRYALIENTLSHNTVVVNEHKQINLKPAVIKRFDTNGFAKVVEVDAPGKYKETSQYTRTVISCESAPGKTVYLDVFRVKGGKQHDWFMHSNGPEFSTDIKLSAPRKGTLAGEDVAFGEFYDSPEHKAMTGTSRNFAGYRGSGFQYLTNVQAGKTIPGCSFTFPSYSDDKEFKPFKDAFLRLYPLDESKVFISNAVPPRKNNISQPYVKVITRRNTGKEPLESVFATVIETSSKKVSSLDIARVIPIAVPEVAGAKILFKDGRILYMFDSMQKNGFIYDGIKFEGKTGVLLLTAEHNAGQAYITGPGSIATNNRVIIAAAGPYSATVNAVNLATESVTMDKMLPPVINSDIIRIGNFAYRIGWMTNSTLKFYEQSSIRGRFRITKATKAKNAKDGETVYNISPGIPLAATGMGLFAGEKFDVYLGEIKKINEKQISTTAKLEQNQDYWISECTPGDKAVIPNHATGSFKF